MTNGNIVESFYFFFLLALIRRPTRNTATHARAGLLLIQRLALSTTALSHLCIKPANFRTRVYDSINSTGGLAVCTNFFSTPSIGLISSGLSLVSSTAIAGRSGLCPWSCGSYTTVPVPDLCLPTLGAVEVAGLSSCIASSGAGRACNLDSATARSSACTSLFGGSSSRISHPIGGLGGGEMKNNLSLFGAWRC